MNEFEQGLHRAFDTIWDCEIDHPIFEDTVGELMSAVVELYNKMQKRWIPISDRLPEEDGDYFVTLENGVVKILGYSTMQRTTYPKGFYYISNGCSWRQTKNPVVAWMPLPEPYKEQEHDS